ncbi:hypothetical protein [Psychrobacter piscatorii]|uniref:Uncharacterized protein n=1 Tax=Psychrobacter piscatorii TaxID=554343 RepID=A0A0T6DUI0_9GAMM|nr:hypothetical protein [Psychrobacter piscatorii]KRU23525.1 hypothetical protein AS194_03925 [Psychrobacter piscatorii]
MSQYQTNGSVPPTRAQQEIERLQTILSERNQQLQAAEQIITRTQINHKQAHKTMRLLMVFCVLLIVVLSWGGAA